MISSGRMLRVKDNGRIAVFEQRIKGLTAEFETGNKNYEDALVKQASK